MDASTANISAQDDEARTRLIALALLVVVDLLAKILAYAVLPENEPLERDAALQFVLRTNDTALGTWARAVQGSSPIAAGDFVSGGCTSLGTALGVLAVHRKAWPRWEKLARIVGLALCGYVLGHLFEGLADGAPPNVPMAVSRLGGATLFFSLWWISAPGVWRVATFLFSAAAFGNLLSLCYPPFAVVDFIYSGPISSAIHVGVFNIADLYFKLALPLTVLALARVVARLVWRAAAISLRSGR